MFKSVSYYLKILIIDGHIWQQTDICGKTKKLPLYFSLSQFLFLIISILIALYASILSKDFIGYIIASFSIFIALFLQLIVSVYSRFGELTNDINTEDKQILAIQIKNFSKQFTSLLSYAILIAILCVILLSISLITDYFNSELLNKDIFCHFDKIENITFKNIISFFYRTLVFYFLFDFFFLLVYGISSFYNFMKHDFSSKKIK